MEKAAQCTPAELEWVMEQYGNRVYRLVETEDGQRVEETIAKGPWQIKFRIDESTYVGPRDDGVPQTTSIE